MGDSQKSEDSRNLTAINPSRCMDLFSSKEMRQAGENQFRQSVTSHRISLDGRCNRHLLHGEFIFCR